MEDVANESPKDERCKMSKCQDVKMLDGQMHLYKHVHMHASTQCACTLNMYPKMNPAFKSDDTTGWPQE